MATIDDVLRTAAAIVAQLDAQSEQLRTLTERLDRLVATLATPAARPAPPSAPAGAVADDRDLDGQWGDPTVRKDPPRWTGASYAGKRYSECPPDYLDTLAGLLDWQAGKDEEKGDEQSVKYAGYKRKDAARARGWARRNAGKPAAPVVEAGYGDGGGAGDELPF